MRTVYEVSLKILLRIKWLNVKGSFVFHFSYVLQLLRLLITRRLLRGKKCLEEWQSQRDNLSTGLKARKIPLLLSGKESQKESDAHFYRVCNQRNLDLRLLISTETNLAERRHRNVSKTVSLQLLQLSRLSKKKKKKKKERKKNYTNKISYLLWIFYTKSSNHKSKTKVSSHRLFSWSEEWNKKLSLGFHGLHARLHDYPSIDQISYPDESPSGRCTEGCRIEWPYPRKITDPR